MKYPRPPYLAEGIPVKEYGSVFAKSKIMIPQLEYPIDIRENFKRAYTRNNPVWVPNTMTDMCNVMNSVLTGAPEADWTRKDRYDWTDWFGVEWTFVPDAGGPMLKPGTQFLDDITKWESRVKFPDLNAYDIKGCCETWLKEKYEPGKILHVNIGQGCTERLVALLGGYTDAMVALAVEPEAVKDFLEAFVDFTIKFFDKLYEYLPIDMITYHDDWGTERDTFFSERMMEEIVYDPTKRLFDHFKSKDLCLEHHCCGRIERFLPYMVEQGADFLQIQARANNIKMLKEKYGDKIGFNVMVMADSENIEDVQANVRKVVDTYGKGGGLYSGVMGGTPKAVWDTVMELFAYSREYYEENN